MTSAPPRSMRMSRAVKSLIASSACGEALLTGFPRAAMLHVGYASELPGPGTFCTKTVMGRSILMTRIADGTVKAFDNVCLHRQSQVVSGCGSACRFTCPYHAWTYDLEGKLVGVPGRE